MQIFTSLPLLLIALEGGKGWPQTENYSQDSVIGSSFCYFGPCFTISSAHGFYAAAVSFLIPPPPNPVIVHSTVILASYSLLWPTIFHAMRAPRSCYL